MLQLLAFLIVLLTTPAWAQQATLSWTDNSAISCPSAPAENCQEDYFVVERKLGAGAFADIFHTAPDATTYADTGVATGSTYTWRVKAVNAAGQSAYSNEATAVITQVAGTPSLTCVYTNPAAPPFPAGVVAAYKLDAGSGTVATDGSGNANTGTLTNGPTWVAGNTGQAVNFDGANDFINVADANTLDLTTGGTMAAYVKLASLNRWHGIVGKGNVNSDPAHNYALEITDTNVARCILGDGVNYQQLDSAFGAAGAWRHVACTWDATIVRLYINKVQVASAARAVAPAGNTSPLFIGQFGASSDFLAGALDDVELYSRALTAAEIGAL